MRNTIKDYLSEMTKPILTLKLISTLLCDYIEDEVVTTMHENQSEKDRNTSALLYVISLLQNEIKEYQNNCYDSLYKK